MSVSDSFDAPCWVFRGLTTPSVIYRLISRRGLDGATLREVAADAGYANGAIKPYFPTKSALLQATYRHVFERTNARSAAATQALAGLAALRAFCLEVLPLDVERLDEARVVIAFWQLALQEPEQAEVNDAAMFHWRSNIRSWLEKVRAALRMLSRTGQSQPTSRWAWPTA